VYPHFRALEGIRTTACNEYASAIRWSVEAEAPLLTLSAAAASPRAWPTGQQAAACVSSRQCKHGVTDKELERPPGCLSLTRSVYHRWARIRLD
jgi:hypothetical protein